MVDFVCHFCKHDKEAPLHYENEIAFCECYREAAKTATACRQQVEKYKTTYVLPVRRNNAILQPIYTGKVNARTSSEMLWVLNNETYEQYCERQQLSFLDAQLRRSLYDDHKKSLEPKK